MHHYYDLAVWRAGMDLVVEVYRTTDAFPRREMYSLTDQLRRAAVSIVSNIAEGKGRSSRTDFARFLTMSRGSINEVATQLHIAARLDYITPATRDRLLAECTLCAKMLSALIRSLLYPGH